MNIVSAWLGNVFYFFNIYVHVSHSSICDIFIIRQNEYLGFVDRNKLVYLTKLSLAAREFYIGRKNTYWLSQTFWMVLLSRFMFWAVMFMRI